MLVPTEKQIIANLSPRKSIVLDILDVEGDNFVLDILDVASQHGSLCAESRDGTPHGVEVIGSLAATEEKGFSAFVIPNTSDVAIALVILVNTKLALKIPAQLYRGAHDGLIKVPELFHIKQNQSRQS